MLDIYVLGCAIKDRFPARLSTIYGLYFLLSKINKEFCVSQFLSLREVSQFGHSGLSLRFVSQVCLSGLSLRFVSQF